MVLDGLDWIWIWIGTGWIGGLDWIGGMILWETPLARVADPTHALLTTVCAMFNADASHGFFSLSTEIYWRTTQSAAISINDTSKCPTNLLDSSISLLHVLFSC